MQKWRQAQDSTCRMDTSLSQPQTLCCLPTLWCKTPCLQTGKTGQHAHISTEHGLTQGEQSLARADLQTQPAKQVATAVSPSQHCLLWRGSVERERGAAHVQSARRHGAAAGRQPQRPCACADAQPGGRVLGARPYAPLAGGPLRGGRARHSHAGARQSQPPQHRSQEQVWLSLTASLASPCGPVQRLYCTQQDMRLFSAQALDIPLDYGLSCGTLSSR